MSAAPSSAEPRRLEAITGMNLLGQPSFCAVFQDTVARFPDWVALRTLDRRTSLTWGQYGDRVEAIARGMAALGIRRGDTVGFLMGNRPEFFPADVAAMHLGAACLSVYQTLPAKDIAWAVEDSGIALMFTDAASLPLAL
jgi:long-subunit acyl-CoA synthetase (AMP-forming)